MWVDATRAAREAEAVARGAPQAGVFAPARRAPDGGHAGSDLETGYRARAEIEAEADHDPLLHTARRMIETGAASREDVERLYTDLSGRVRRAMEAACDRPKLATAAATVEPLIPKRRRRAPKPGKILPAAPDDARARAEPQHMSRLISLALAAEMERDRDIVVFGEDVGRKGGVLRRNDAVATEIRAGARL